MLRRLRRGVLQRDEAPPAGRPPRRGGRSGSAPEGLRQRGSRAGRVEGSHEEGAPVEAGLGLPGRHRRRARQVGDRHHGQFLEQVPGTVRGAPQAHRVAVAAGQLDPLPHAPLDPLAPLGHEGDGVPTGVRLPPVEHRRVWRPEIARPRHLQQPVHEPLKVQPHVGGADQVGAVLAETRQAVHLQDVEAALAVEAEVHPGAVVQTERPERRHGEFLRPAAQLLADRRRADRFDAATAATGLVLVGVDLRPARPEGQLHGGKRLGRPVAQQPDVHLPPLDEALHEHRLAVFLEDQARPGPQFLVVSHDAQPERHGLVLRLDDGRVDDLGRDGHVGRLQHRELRRGDAVLAQDHLGDDLVQRQGVPQRTPRPRTGCRPSPGCSARACNEPGPAGRRRR